jgi:pimeloyl-ACP methyl ester carboxylesterase
MTQAHLEAAPAIAEGSVHSADGTRIAFHRLGSGPALVFVHGSVSTHKDWMPVAKLLADRFTCYAMDRRGRARSGTGASPYSIDREYEDICAVLALAGPGAGLVAHSFGAICAMGAALRAPVPRLVLYEPTIPVGGLIAGEYLEPYVRAMDEGDQDRALHIGLTHFTRYSAGEVAALRKSRAWPRLRTMAASWIREMEAMDALSPDVECYRALACPTLMLVGSLSPEHPMQDCTRALAKVLPHVRVEVLAGQNHMGMRMAPAVVARLIGDFLAP